MGPAAPSWGCAPTQFVDAISGYKMQRASVRRQLKPNRYRRCQANQRRASVLDGDVAHMADMRSRKQ